MPARRDLDPAQMRSALPRIWIFDYDPEDDCPRFRLVGEEIRTLYPVDLRGRCLTDLFPEHERAAVLERQRRVVRDRCVLHAIGRVYGAIGRSGAGERVALPLASDGVTPDGLVGATQYDWDSGTGPDLPGRQEMIVTCTPVDGSPATVEGSNSDPVVMRLSYNPGRE